MEAPSPSAPSAPSSAQNAKKVFVGNLPFSITKTDLEALFSRVRRREHILLFWCLMA
jgi:RNA recognition motif-containing protein